MGGPIAQSRLNLFSIKHYYYYYNLLQKQHDAAALTEHLQYDDDAHLADVRPGRV